MDDLKAILGAATPGPWEYRPGYTDAIIDAEGNTIVFDEFGFMDDADARLIAMAPDLAAEVLRLRAENERLRVELYGWQARSEFSEAQFEAAQDRLAKKRAALAKRKEG